MIATKLSASEARCAILDLSDQHDASAILHALVVAMSGDEARQHLEWLQEEGF